MIALLVVLFICSSLSSTQGLQLTQGAYEDLVVSISDNVSGEDCHTLISNLKTTLTDSSQFLFDALDSRAYIRSATIIIPGSWPDSCAQGPIGPSSGESSDISIIPKGPTGTYTWTQQSAGCGKSGDQIYVTSEAVQNSDYSFSRILVKEFAKYRYGVFDEHGYDQDQVYPMCYKENDDEPLKVTSCSDMTVHDNGICSNTQMPLNVSDLVEPIARSSIMFAAGAPSVNMFCDEGTHDRNAPTKHNFMCKRRSTLDVILQHADFFGNVAQTSNQYSNTTFTIKKQTMTRYVVIIEDTKEMLLRESWTYLRNAIRKWAVHDLLSNTEVGLVMVNDVKAVKRLDITSLKNPTDRDLVGSSIPYTPGDSRAAPCLQCAIKDSIQMLKNRVRSHGPANSVILIIAPGMEYSHEVPELAKEARNTKIKIATINYPGIIRQQMLDSISAETGGLSFTVQEKKHNFDTSLLTTYFQLTNVLYNIGQRYYQGNPLNLPIEIHRKELTDDGRNSVTGSFVVDPDLGEPARFAVFTHNGDSPLIKSLTLWSPSQVQYQRISESLLSVKIITIAATINETGTWTYKVERFSGNPQPHFIQVMATPRSTAASVVRSRFWTGKNQAGGPLVLYVEVKKQERPVMAAKVEVTVTRQEFNGTGIQKEKFDLLDTGSGDPDVTKGDGIYSRYFSAASAGGAGLYTFEVTVTDNGNTAYAVPDDEDTSDSDKPCCGSFIQKSRVTTLQPFQRVLPPITKFITPEEILSAGQLTIGRIGDLKAQVSKDEQRVKLIWTAPDMGGYNVARYEIKFANSIYDITEKYEINAIIWEHGIPFPQSPGSETSFTLNFTQEPTLLDKPLYFAVKAFSQISHDATSGPISNWVRVFVASPPPPPSPTYLYPSTNVFTWPNNSYKSVNVVNVGPRLSSGLDLGLQLILPIVFGVVLLSIIMAAYCYCCVVKRRKRNDDLKTNKMSNVTIVPSATNTALPSVNNSPQHNNAYTTDSSDHHTVGVPIYQDQQYDDEKKRLSIVHQQEQQLIDELKQQQQHQHLLHLQQQRDHMQTPNNTYSGALSVISNNTLQRNGRTLSPYESWSASDLLHEHERRHSPSMMDGMIPEEMMPNHHQVDHLSITGQCLDHMSVSGQHFNVVAPPPVPPLPSYNGYPVNYTIYGVHQPPQHQPPPNGGLYQALHRNENLPAFNSSLQGSMSSVNSGEKKRRNVTMV